MDFITNLPISNGFDSIFIVVDQGLSKGVILCPCNKMIDAEGTIKLYIDNVFIQFGLPDIIISDRGPQFTSNVFNGILDKIGIKHRMSTAYHPQTDGQTECYNLCDVGRCYARQVRGHFFKLLVYYVSYTNIYDHQNFIIAVL